jgi:hypothetical protein
LPRPLFWGKVSQLTACCQHVVIVQCLFFNFAELFDFGYCSLAKEMSFVDCYLPYFRQWLITHLLSALLPFKHLFTDISHRDQLLVSPLFSSVLSASHPLCCALVFSRLFLQFFFFCRVSVCSGGYDGLSQGWLEYLALICLAC